MRSAAPIGETTVLPGTRASCALLTVLTILMAWPSPPPLLGVLVRAGYFGLLAWFFMRTTAESPALQGQPMRLVRGGFLVLTLGFGLSAAIQIAGLEMVHPAVTYLCATCERGAMFLLGTTLVSYGLMLWLPQVLLSHRLLGEHNARQSGALKQAESARSMLEHRLVEADRRGMLGELAATIAHDLRNPLTIVQGTAESLCRRPRSQQEIAEHTAVIRRNIDKADRTIQALIDLAKPRRQEPSKVAAHELFGEVADLLRVEAKRRHTTLQVAVPHAGMHLVTDRTLLAQALLNLVLNAIQASRGDGGKVRMHARAVRLGGRALLALAIDDEGNGPPPEIQRSTFPPFFTTKPEGTGLGLSSCRRIADELGGALRLYPRQRGGARALLLLPQDHDSPAAAPNADGRLACASTSC